MRIFYTFIFALLLTDIFAQTKEFRAAYDSFRNQTMKEYEDFRIRAIKDYAEFVRQAWVLHKTLPAVPKPKEEEVPPVVIKDEEKDKPIEDKPVVIEEVIDVPQPEPHPKPVSPIKEQPVPVETYLSFNLYGTTMKVRANDGMKFRLKNLELETIADIWEQRFATNDYNNMIRDCLENRIRYQLSDWAYLRMLDVLCSEFLGKGTDEAELLKAFLYCQSGYQMRLAFADNHLVMLYASKHFIFEKPCWEIDEQLYFADDVTADEIMICGAAFPNEQGLSLLISAEQKFASKPSKERTITASDADWLSVKVSENENLIAFYNEYPVSCLGEDFMTRWATYANTPLSENVTTTLYPQFERIFDEVKKVNISSGYDMSWLLHAYVDLLCHWIQTGFTYEYDDKVWGGDRAFFADETLFYPYCDCEDRSILLTRLVRDLLGLKCALVYYPGHLATAIAIGENVKGDYIRIDGVKYLICDPTYIGAPIGMTMPKMDNKTAIVIVLR